MQLLILAWASVSVYCGQGFQETKQLGKHCYSTVIWFSSTHNITGL